MIIIIIIISRNQNGHVNKLQIEIRKNKKSVFEQLSQYFSGYSLSIAQYI